MIPANRFVFAHKLGSRKVQRRNGVFMKGLKDFFREEEGVAIIEIVLILVILIGLVVVFKNKITTLNNKILTRITTESNKIL